MLRWEIDGLTVSSTADAVGTFGGLLGLTLRERRCRNLRDARKTAGEIDLIQRRQKTPFRKYRPSGVLVAISFRTKPSGYLRNGLQRAF